MPLPCSGRPGLALWNEGRCPAGRPLCVVAVRLCRAPSHFLATGDSSLQCGFMRGSC